MQVKNNKSYCSMVLSLFKNTKKEMNKISNEEQPLSIVDQETNKDLLAADNEKTFGNIKPQLYQYNSNQLKEIIEKYRQRKYVDDLDYIKSEFGGVTGLLDGIEVNPDIGIETENLSKRERAFGSHYKSPPVRTPYFTLLWEQL